MRSTDTTSARGSGGVKDFGKPLPAASRAALVASTTALVAVLYLFCITALITMLVLILFEVVILMGAARFGLMAYMVHALEALIRLAKAVSRSLFLKRGAAFRMPLLRQDAPRLYEKTENLARRIGVRPPDEVVTEMTSRGYVELSGRRRGSGRWLLCIGYDLLAGLQEPEIEFVIAHELAHAKHVQRGYHRWLFGGLQRIYVLAGAVDEILTETAQRKKRFYAASAISAAAHFLGKSASRLFSAYSREKEFAADRTAAEVCGSGVARQTLIKLEVLDTVRQKITWRDRVTRVQRGGSFSEWLCSRLTADDIERADIERRAFSLSRTTDLDTHPALRDRLAPLPDEPDTQPPCGKPAIGLLADPDAAAEKLMAEVERLATEEQRKHTLTEEKKARERSGSHRYADAQVLMIVIMLILFVILVSASIILDGYPPAYARMTMLLCSVGIVLAVIGCFKWAPGNGRKLRLPLISLWEETLNDKCRNEPVESWLPQVKAELLSRRPERLRWRRHLARYWAEESYNALERCDYKSALAASDLCLEAHKTCLEGLLARTVASAYFLHNTECSQAFGKVLQKHNLKGSIAAACGWSNALWGQWDKAEGYFLIAAADRRDDANLLCVIAACQWRKGKHLEAIERVKRAVELVPHETAYREMLAELMIAVGRAKDAHSHLQILESSGPLTSRMLAAAVRANLLLGRCEEGRRYEAKLLETDPGGNTLLRIGSAYEEAEMDAEAEGYYEQALDAGYAPAALLGLARIQYRRKNHDRSRELLRSTLDLTRQIAPDADEPLAFLPEVCRAITSLAEPVESCRAWSVTVDMKDSPAPLDDLSFLVAAPDRQSAAAYVRWVYNAMHPDRQLADSMAKWEDAPAEQQPSGPMRPGIYAWWGKESQRIYPLAGADDQQAA